MPELPDLEVFSKNLEKKLKRKKLTGLAVMPAAKTSPGGKALVRALLGKTLQSVVREGKELHFSFSGGQLLGLHMMLHGKLTWVSDARPPHTLLEFEFGKIKLALTDFQKAAKATLNPAPSTAPDALASSLTVVTFRKMLQSRAAIKKLLLDQHTIRGIGNAYADEILWAARIDPGSISSAIPLQKVKDLHKAIRSTLRLGIRQVKKAEPDIIGGENRDFLIIHNAKKSTSPTGGKILKSTAGGRKTYYTKEQKLYK